MAFIVAALLPIGKLAKAGKLGTAGTKVMQSIETGVKQFKNTVKYLEAHIGQAVKSYRWNEADLAYDAQLADGSTRSVSKAELDGGSASASGSGGNTFGGSGTSSFPVQPRYVDEIIHYSKEKPFDAKKMINDDLITKTRYNVDELDILLNDFIGKGVGKSVEGKQGEIIFVMKQNGEMVFSMRRADDYLPHPVLSYGEDVLSAGTIAKLDDGTLEITRKSGHFQPELDSLTQVRENLELNGYDVEINPSFQ